MIGDHLDKQALPSPLDDKLSTCQKPEAAAKADAVHFDGADDPRDLQEMRSQLVEHKSAYKGQLQCIKKFDGSNDYGSIFDVH